MSKRKNIYVRLASLCLLLIIAAFTAGAILNSSKWAKTTKSTSRSAPDQQTEPIRNIRLTVYDMGIYPQEMEVEAGRLSIVFDDRTGKSSGYVIERITGAVPERAGRINAAKDHWRTRSEVRVVPGRYRVFVSERPEIQSVLIVNP